jgi:hypothetical protein
MTEKLQKVLARQGIVVNRLIRVHFCDIILPRSLKPGRFMELYGKV